MAAQPNDKNLRDTLRKEMAAIACELLIQARKYNGLTGNGSTDERTEGTAALALAISIIAHQVGASMDFAEADTPHLLVVSHPTLTHRL